MRWFALTYGRDPQRVRGFSFNADLLPSRDAATAQQAQSREQLQALADQLAERDQQLRDQRLAALASQEELERLRQEITALRKANEAAAQPEPDRSEFETRRAYIDHDLEEAGWVHGQSCTHEHEVQGMPNATGQGFVDYVLWGDDGKPLGLVEAKRSSRDPMEGQRQAELYANCLEQRYGQRPLIFLSNGYRHRIWDDLRYPPREIQGFYKNDELETLIRRREIRQPLAQATISTAIAGRYYQQRAIRAICESLEQGRLKALLVQVTGTGKTRTAISLTDVLTRCNWVKRVLFLADRTSLVLQAERAFRKFLPDCSPVNLVTNKGGEGQFIHHSVVGQIEAVARVGKSADHRWGGSAEIGPRQSPLWAVDPEIDAIAQPVVILFAGLKCCLSTQNCFSNSTTAHPSSSIPNAATSVGRNSMPSTRTSTAPIAMSCATSSTPPM